MSTTIGDVAWLEPTRRTLQRNLRSRGETLAWTALALDLLEEDAGSRGEVASPDGIEPASSRPAEFATFIREQAELHKRLVEDVDLKLGQ